jgi:eukaryotic-like serine/threonine-protein kinase
MELLAGKTLADTLKGGALPWREAIGVAVAAARALEAAHAAGLVHRDIKPQNLMMTGAGEVKLLDFGVAMALTDGSDKKPTEKERALRGFAIFGTPEYMAPEQVSGDPIDGRTDVYALGCVLYEMLTGERAFEGPSSVVVMGKQLRETPLPPRAVAASRSIPRELDAIVMRAMSKLPCDRFESADAMRVALDELVEAPVRQRESFRRTVSRVGVALAMVAAAAGSAYWARTSPRVTEAALVLPPATPSATAPVPSPVLSPSAPAAMPLAVTISLAPTAVATSAPTRETRPSPARAHEPRVHTASARALAQR